MNLAGQPPGEEIPCLADGTNGAGGRPQRSFPWRLLFVALAGAWLVFFAYFPGLFATAGVQRFQGQAAPNRMVDLWFLDSFAVLAANDAVALGRDPYALNPLDHFQRPHIYGPAWLHLRQFGWTRADNEWFGFTMGAAFVVVALLGLRPRNLGSLLGFLAVFGSIPVLLALERANNDLVIFVLLAPVVPCLLSQRAGWRWVAVGLVAAAADLKFYPAVAALVWLAAAPVLELRRRLLWGGVVFLLVAWHIGPDLLRILPWLPPAEGVFTFGAVSGFRELGWTGRVPQLLVWATGAAIFLGAWRRRVLGDWQPSPTGRGAWLSFVLGATLLTACFFVGQNYAYRWIFALWLAPWLWTIPRESDAPARVRRWAVMTRWLLLVALWFDPVCTWVLSRVPGLDLARALHWVFLAGQPLTWALFACLLTCLAHFARDGWARLRGREAEGAA